MSQALKKKIRKFLRGWVGGWVGGREGRGLMKNQRNKRMHILTGPGSGAGL